jgi:hypothetical protein
MGCGIPGSESVTEGCACYVWLMKTILISCGALLVALILAYGGAKAARSARNIGETPTPTPP